MTTPDAIARALDRLRQRYPAGLICVTCLAILATRPESYGHSALTEPARLVYICAECRADQAEVERLAGVRRANLARARAKLGASRNGRGQRDETPVVGTPTGGHVTPPSRTPNLAELHDGVSSRPDVPG